MAKSLPENLSDEELRNLSDRLREWERKNPEFRSEMILDRIRDRTVSARLNRLLGAPEAESPQESSAWTRRLDRWIKGTPSFEFAHLRQIVLHLIDRDAAPLAEGLIPDISARIKVYPPSEIGLFEKELNDRLPIFPPENRERMMGVLRAGLLPVALSEHLGDTPRSFLRPGARSAWYEKLADLVEQAHGTQTQDVEALITHYLNRSADPAIETTIETAIGKLKTPAGNGGYARLRRLLWGKTRSDFFSPSLAKFKFWLKQRYSKLVTEELQKLLDGEDGNNYVKLNQFIRSVYEFQFRDFNVALAPALRSGLGSDRKIQLPRLLETVRTLPSQDEIAKMEAQLSEWIDSDPGEHSKRMAEAQEIRKMVESRFIGFPKISP